MAGTLCSRRFGRKKFAEVLAPAIAYAEKTVFPVGEVGEHLLARTVKRCFATMLQLRKLFS